MRRVGLIVCSALLSVVAFSAVAQERADTPLKTSVPDEQAIAELTAEIPRLMGEGLVPGLSVALIRNGEVV